MEFSSIQAIDFSLGHLLVSVFSGHELNGPANWRSFLGRPNNKRILRFDFESVQDILKVVEGSQNQASQSGTTKENATSLPLVVYGRKSPILTAAPDAGANIARKTVSAPSGEAISLTLSQVQVDYRVALLAQDRLTLDTMQLAWLFHMVESTDNSRFEYELKLQGVDEPLNFAVTMLDPKTPIFEPSDLVRTEGRLYCVMFNVSLRAYAVKGGAVTVPSTIGWGLISPSDQAYGPGSGEGGPCIGGICWPNKQ